MAEPLLVVDGLNAHYGSAHALHDLSFSMGAEAVAVIGRNGMGKTTLCNALMGVPPVNASGSARFDGTELIGRQSYKTAALGIGYVPQGRRLLPSLTVDEHLRMMRGSGSGGRHWTPAEIYELFPRLAQRKKNGGAQLSGGEQQMLAIGRALLTDPRLVIMDEPSEGLAPAIVEQLIDVFTKLVKEGLGLLIIEQNLGMATAIADRQLVMATGSIIAETTASELANDPDAQRRYLGVEPVAH